MAGKAPAAAYADYSFPDDHCSSSDNCRSSAVGLVAAQWMCLVNRPPPITGSRWTADRTGLERPSRRARPNWSPAPSAAFPSTHPHAPHRPCRRQLRQGQVGGTDSAPREWSYPAAEAGRGQRGGIRTEPNPLGRPQLIDRGADGAGSVSPCRESPPSDASGPAARPSAWSPRPGRTRQCPRPSADHDRVAAGHPSSCRG
jgi:hypothetical protein